ncbi:hypothetical protein [Pleomorphovibrio marinus]|uniref:hypothetical protein n=1 Tax=Pleomorphovibrio marinus TaxID=2164132 RepID=UPI000E0ACD75|nr:hypothetical protein [Pleomorphovibrio marinus]
MTTSPEIWPNSQNINKEAETIKNPAFRGAFMKGVKACQHEGIKAENPYQPIYQFQSSRPTFAMVFMKYWDKGFKAWERHQNNNK